MVLGDGGDVARETRTRAVVEAAMMVATGIIPPKRKSRLAPMPDFMNNQIHVVAVARTQA